MDDSAAGDQAVCGQFRGHRHHHRPHGHARQGEVAARSAGGEIGADFLRHRRQGGPLANLLHDVDRDPEERRDQPQGRVRVQDALHLLPRFAERPGESLIARGVDGGEADVLGRIGDDLLHPAGEGIAF